MQQKYCDHGRSAAMLKITWPALRACSSCGSGGNPRKASILPSTNSSSGLTDGSVTQRMSLAGSSPTWAAISVSNAAGAALMPTLALQLGDILDAFPGDQFKAADMHAGEHDDRHPGIDPRDMTARKEIA